MSVNAQLLSFLAVALGGALGSCSRYALSALNAHHPWMPLGTLGANVIGGLLMGGVLVYARQLAPLTQLFVATGFLGGLTTFSTFSAEVNLLIAEAKVLQAMLWIALQVGLTLMATALSFYALKALS